jgi:glycerophosphoryl diester phosphodiesterase
MLFRNYTKKPKRIEKAGIDVTVMSFSWFAIERIKALDSKISTTYLLHDYTPWFSTRYSSAHSIGPGIGATSQKACVSAEDKSGRQEIKCLDR